MRGLGHSALTRSIPGQNEAPVRVKLSRAKGWRMPPHTVKVDRSTPFGNPWTPGEPGTVRMAMIRGGWDVVRLPFTITLDGCVDRHRRWVRGEFTGADGAIRMDHPIYGAVICDEPPDLTALRGKNLACWCALDAPCHADVLLELANARPDTPTANLTLAGYEGEAEVNNKESLLP